MDVHAKARYIRISPRKVRLVLDAVRNMKAQEAVIHLQLLPQKAARPVKKLIESAIANAENNFKLNPKELTIKSLVADDGPTFKRFRARAFGRAAMIRKRTSHIAVILTDGKENKVEAVKETKNKESKKEVAKDKTTEAAKEAKKEEKKDIKKETKKPAAKKEKKSDTEKKATKKTTKKSNS